MRCASVAASALALLAFLGTASAEGLPLPPEVCEPPTHVGPLYLGWIGLHPCLINPTPLLELPCLIVDDRFPDFCGSVVEGCELAVGGVLGAPDVMVNFTANQLDAVQPGAGDATHDAYAPASEAIHGAQPLCSVLPDP